MFLHVELINNDQSHVACSPVKAYTPFELGDASVPLDGGSVAPVSRCFLGTFSASSDTKQAARPAAPGARTPERCQNRGFSRG